MISALPTTYIEYKDLSKSTNIAEIQKDIIVQFLKALKKDNSIIVDNSEHQSLSTEKDSNFIIHCLQCNVELNSDYEIVLPSISKTKNTFNNHYTFELRNEKNLKTTWRLEIIEKKQIYYIAAKQNISPNSILTSKDIEISSCATDENKCNPKYFYLTKQEAENSINKVTNKRSNFPIRQGKEIEILNLSQEILVHAGEKIKIIYSPTQMLTIQTYGKSLSNAGLGESIRVQISNWFENSSVPHPTGIIEGTVVAPGEVEYAIK